MSLETGNYISALDSVNPTGSDPKSRGDDHLRLIKSTLKNSFAGITGAVIVGGTNGGVANVYTLTPTPTLVSYITNMTIVFSPVVSNTGASTIDVSGLGAINLRSVSGAALITGELVAGQTYKAIFNGTEFRLDSITKAYADQLAFSTALPAQSLGFLASNGTVAAFTKTFTGYAVDESKGANVASAATIDLQNTVVTGNLIHITGTTTITAITLPAGAERTLIFDGALTLTHSANLDVPGAASITTAAGDRAIVRGEGSSAVRVISYVKANGQAIASAPIGDHEVIVRTGNGHGSTNTAIRRFQTISVNIGTAITYADSATLGASFTINETGIYAIQYTDDFSANRIIGISRNSTTNTIALDSSTPTAERIAMSGTFSGLGLPANAVRVTKLSAGDVIRANDGGNADNTSGFAFFSLRKVGPAP